MEEKTFYEVLNVEETASLEDIKHHYHKLARLYHPDITKLENTHDRFIEINFAYKTLKDPMLRKAYDFGLKKRREKEGKVVTSPSSFKTSDNTTNTVNSEKTVKVEKKPVTTQMKADFEMLRKKANENFANGNFREALMNVEEALDVNDQSYEMWKIKGNIHLKQKNYELAMESFSKACKIDDNPEIRSLLSEAISGRSGSSSSTPTGKKKKGLFGLF